MSTLRFDGPSEVQGKCEKMCRQMEECGLMTLRRSGWLCLVEGDAFISFGDVMTNVRGV